MEKLIGKIRNELDELYEIYEFHLEQLNENYSKWVEERLKELRIEIKTYEKVLEMIKSE